MNDQPTMDYVRQAEHDRLQAQMDAFLAKGGQIQRLPMGQITDDASAPRTVLRGTPPAVEKPPHINRPEAGLQPAKPRPSRAKPKEGPKGPQVLGDKVKATLAALAAGCLSAKEVAAYTGKKRGAEATRLWELSQKGVLIKRGGRFSTTWHIKATSCP